VIRSQNHIDHLIFSIVWTFWIKLLHSSKKARTSKEIRFTKECEAIANERRTKARRTKARRAKEKRRTKERT